MEKKILDASIWITLAALFYFWCILFFAVLFVAIIQQQSKNYNLLLIPFVGFLSIMVIATTFDLLQGNSFLWFLKTDKSVGLNYESYNTISLIIPISILVSFSVLALFNKIIKFSGIRLKEKSKAALLVLILVTSLAVALLFPNKTGGELLYIMAPLAILTANFIEKLHIYWMKELILWLALIFPMIIAFL